MAKKKLYRSVLRVELLSEEPLPNDSISLTDVSHQITNGDWSGGWGWQTRNSILTGKFAADAARLHGSDPEFFQMDAEGNELED